MNFRQMIQAHQQADRLVRISKPVSLIHQMSGLISSLGKRPALFQTPKESTIPVATNILAQRKSVCLALGTTPAALTQHIARAIDQPQTPPIQTQSPFTETKPAFSSLPILTHFPQDGGPYITSGIFIIADAEWGLNASFHRLMLVDDTHGAVRIVERDFHQYLERGNREFAICIGAPIQAQLAAAISVETQTSELAIANALKATPLIELDGHLVPDAEFVIIAEMTDATHPEGPFIDLTQTRDIVRQQRLIRIKRVYHKPDPIYHAILPGGYEHKILMGLPKEPTIWRSVNQVVRCLDVCITTGGCSWLHAVVQIDKQSDQDGARAIQAAFFGHRSLKHVVIVDADIDIYNPEEVEWAIATRFQAADDLTILSKEIGSSLDPSSNLDTRHTSKMGLDATIPHHRQASEFMRPVVGGKLDPEGFV